ncbi:DoxX family protein [Marinicella sp. W31]|uniref:HvfX family Cu-binding RiPP maturation protein n=1 Tax=Marinicella sp. W31 TaxID=3023713 RepID=UPI003757F190
MALKETWSALTARLNSGGQWLPPLALRLILFWEFWEAGMQKHNGSNWFTSIQDNFPFPFDSIPANVSWAMATYGEIIGAVLLLLGLFTRFAAISIIVITAVATAAVHWPESWGSLGQLWESYAISKGDGTGNFKLPLIFIVMALPLVFSGGGKLSLDNLLSRFMGNTDSNRVVSDFASIGLVLLVLGVTLYFVMPVFGLLLLAGGVALILANKFMTPKG